MKNSRTITRASGVVVFLASLCIFLLASTVSCSGDAASASAKAAPAKPASKKEAAPQSLPLLVDVGADKCVPCIMMAPILEELKKEYTGVLHVKFVDAWKDPDEARKYRVRGIPTQIFYDASGKELGRHMGYLSKEGILKTFEGYGVPIEKPSKE